MSRGNPVEFVRRLRLQADAMQRIGNRIKKEAFEIEADHVAQGGANAAVEVVLPVPGVGNHWRFDFLHISYDGVTAPG